MGRDDAVEVFGRGLGPNEYDLAPLLGQRFRLVGVEDRFARGGAGRGGQAFGEHCDIRFGIHHRMEQLVQVLGRDTLDRLVLRDQTLLDQLHGDTHGRRAGALRAARLQHVQLAALERELDVLHVPEVLLQPRGDARELFEDLGEPPAIHLRDRLWRARAGDDVLALGVHEEIAVQDVLPAAAISCEGDAGAAVVAHVAVHHRHHVHRGAERVGNAVDLAVIHGAARVPAAEHGFDGAP